MQKNKKNVLDCLPRYDLHLYIFIESVENHKYRWDIVL